MQDFQRIDSDKTTIPPGWNAEPLDTILSPELEDRMQVLERAADISRHLEATVANFPFRDHIELMRLKAMISLWLADLMDDCIDQMELLKDDGIEYKDALADVEARIKSATSNPGTGDVTEEALLVRSVRYRHDGRELFRKLTKGD